MAIQDDLKAAKAFKDSLIGVRAAVKQLATKTGVSERDAANWLALKGAHAQLPAYLLFPLGYTNEKLSLSADKRGVWHYQEVYDELLTIAYPDKFQELVDALAFPPAPPPAHAAWEMSEFDAFVLDNGALQSEVEAEGAEAPLTVDTPPRAGVIELRKDKLRAAILARFDDPHNIPVGDKAKLRNEMCAADPRSFTPSTFDKAWQDLSTSGDIAIANKETFQGARGSPSE